MKDLRTHITRFLIVAAALICGYLTLTTGRTAGADSTKNSARPTPDLRGPAAIRRLEQTGLYNSLSAAVTAARYQIEARKEGSHEAANPKQGYLTVFTREGVEVRGASRTGGKWVSLAFQQGSAYVFAPSNQPPDCSGAFPSVTTIWPPNHDMINVTIQGVTDPDGDPVTINIDQIEHDEPTDGTGDGHTCPDGAGIGTSIAQVRAERGAQGDGRVYTIYFTASDGNGGRCQGSVTVCAPKSSNGSCTNGGAIYNSTQCDTSLNWQSGLDRISDLVTPPRDGGEYNVIPLGRVADHLDLRERFAIQITWKGALASYRNEIGTAQAIQGLPKGCLSASYWGIQSYVPVFGWRGHAGIYGHTITGR